MGVMYLHGTIEELLAKTSQRWRWLRFLCLSIVLATVAAGLVLLLGLGMVCGLVATEGAATAWSVVFAIAAILAWMGIGLSSAVAEENRGLLAASIEHAHAPLMDRLNTLVYLQHQGKHPPHPYAEPIERQTRNVIAQAPPLEPFSPAPILARLGVLAAMVALTLLFYGLFRPWQHLKGARGASPVASQEEPPLEIPLPKEPLPEPPREDPPWGEIRITKPGGDVRATPLDAVPLEIEAASNRALKEVEWSTAVNGGAPQRHELPAPADSRSAVYQPKLDLKALGAKEWDVVSYSARAASTDGKSFESDVYFVEVTPLGEELTQIPGGRQGPSDGLLERLTAMIQRQAEVIRQTRRQGQLADQPATDRRLQREALAREEGDLSDSARHLAAEAEGELDESALAAMDERFEQSATTLSEAQKSLLGGELDKSLRNEEAALAALTAARKQFHENLLKDLADGRGQKADGRKQPAQGEDPVTPSLKQRLDEQIAQYDKIEKQPEKPSPGDLQQTTEKTRELLDELQKVASEEPSQDQRQAGEEDSGSELGKEMTKDKREQLDGQCDKLCKGADAGAKKEAAGAVKQGLQKLSNAMAADAARRESDQRGARQAERLAQVQNRQGQLESVREMVKSILAAQRDLERSPDLGNPSTMPRAAQRQRDLQNSLQECVQKNNSSLGNCQKESASAQGAMGRAAQAMQAWNPGAPGMAGEAAAEIQKLNDALEREEERAGLAAAHQLKRMLDHQIGQLSRAEQQGSSSGQAGQLAEQSKSITGEMKRLADERPTSARFGQPLRDALGGQNKQQLDAQSDRLAQAQDSAGRRRASGQLRRGLQQVSRAFDASCPSGVGRSRGSPRKPEGKEALAEGMRQLESTSRRQASAAVQSEGMDSGLVREALAGIEAGLASVYGYNERTQDVFRTLQEELKRTKIVIDVGIVESLLRQIQPLRREVASGTAPAPKEAKQTYIDPSRLPPAYRKSIEQYFQKLSEQ
jgi:hypothetical protein